MASQFYGLKGSLIKTYQKLLNSLGARLSVDGIWGPKTESAYAKYAEGFNSKVFGDMLNAAPAADAAQTQPGVPPAGGEMPEPPEDPYTYLDSAVRDDAALRAAAEGQLGALYDAKAGAVNAEAERTRASLAAELGGLDEAYQNALKSLQETYRRQRQTISDSALSRGMGRSSYVTDQIAGSAQRQTVEEQEALADRMDRETDLRVELENVDSDSQRALAGIGGERESAILAAIESMREQDRKAAGEAIQYNNSLIQAQRKSAADAEASASDLAQQQREWEQKLKLEYRKLAAR